MAPSNQQAHNLTTPKLTAKKALGFSSNVNKFPGLNSHWPELNPMLNHMPVPQPITVAKHMGCATHSCLGSDAHSWRHWHPEPRVLGLRRVVAIKKNHGKLTKERMQSGSNSRMSSHLRGEHIVIPVTSKTQVIES